MNAPHESPASNHTAYSLRMVEGPSVGRVWRITLPVTAIGRAIGCHVHVDDPHVSRVQCELVQDADGLRLRSKAQQNPTYLNDRICDETLVSPGDVISFSGVMFILDIATDPHPAVENVDRHTTRSFADSIELRAQLDPDAYLQDPRLATRTRGLLGFLRALGQAESLEALIDRLQGHVVERLFSEKCWVGWRRDARGAMVLLPPESPENTANAPFEVMEECVTSETGIVVSTPAGANRMIAAPLTHGGESFGAIIARRSGDANEFAEYDLKYLVILAESCAPLLRAAERLEQLRRDAAAVIGGQARTLHILGSSPAIQTLKAELRTAAIARVNVLIQGETGVGKELAARTVHDLSTRATGPYIVVNCAAVAADLFESEMFGHERGAFTGAIRKRKGLFEQAQGGTLFLDEVAELSIANQALLLRAVETGTFRPVGSEKEVQVDVRIVSATNRPLPDTSNKYFRTDLYHRLAGITVRIQPLRERKEDILELAGHFLAMAAPHAPNHPKRFSQDAIDKLRQYNWPGNARQLRNVVERACFTAPSTCISGDDIQLELPAAAAVATTAETASLADVERQHLINVLRHHGNDIIEAARALGISRSAMYYKLARHGIKPPRLTK